MYILEIIKFVVVVAGFLAIVGIALKAILKK
jgi:hypothetical protein